MLTVWVTLIVTALVTGTIVDSFQSRREIAEQSKHNQRSMCFICSKPRSSFSSDGTSFEHHVQHDHCKEQASGQRRMVDA